MTGRTRLPIPVALVFTRLRICRCDFNERGSAQHSGVGGGSGVAQDAAFLSSGLGASKECHFHRFGVYSSICRCLFNPPIVHSFQMALPILCAPSPHLWFVCRFFHLKQILDKCPLFLIIDNIPRIISRQ